MADGEREIIGPYVIGRTIGQGIFAKVKLGEDEYRQKVAIKIFDKALLSRSHHQLLQVEKELNSLRCCHHPNIVQFYDVLETDSKIYLVMEHLSAGELYDYILDQGKLSEEEGGRLFGQIVSAVAHCHRHGIVHRDLKPENVLMRLHHLADGSAHHDATLVDFGLSNYFDTALDPAIRSLQTQCGSPHYASPEILTGAKYSGPLADVWSLGVLLFAMLCGSLPFNARSVPLLIKKIVDGKFKFPKFLSPSSRHLIASILQIQPEQRPTLEEIQRHPWLVQYGGRVEGGEEAPIVPASGLRPLSRPEVINPESGRPMPGDLQRMMAMQKESQRKIIGTDGLPPSNALHFQSEADMLALSSPTHVSSPRPINPGTPSHSSRGSPVQGPVSASGSFFTDLLSFPSPRSKRKNVQCQFCGKSLNVRVGEAGNLLIASDDRYELCSCMRTRSQSPSIGDGEKERDAVDDSASSFNDTSFREAYFHPDDPRRKSKHRTSSLSQEAELLRARNEERFLRACETGDVDTVITLIEPPTDELGLSTGPPLVDVRAKHIDNWTGLHYAARGGHVDVIQALLSSLQPLDINCRTKSNWSALMIASDKGHIEVVQLLVRYGAAIHIVNSDGKSAIFLARESGYHEIAQLLTHASSVRHKRHAKLNDHEDRTEEKEKEKSLNYELFRAAEYGDLSKVQHLLALNHATEKDHVSRRQKDKKDSHEVSVQDSPCKYTVDIAARGIDHWTALHFAARKGRTEVVALLLSNAPPAPINAQTKNGWTALMMACDKGNEGVVRLLLDRGADAAVKSVDGYSAWRVAKEGGHDGIVKLLLDYAEKGKRDKEQRERKEREEQPGGAGNEGSGEVSQAVPPPVPARKELTPLNIQSHP